MEVQKVCATENGLLNDCACRSHELEHTLDN